MNADHVDCDIRGPFKPHVLGPLEQLPMHCGHCGLRYVLALPVSLGMLAVVAKQFVREHQRCKPPPNDTSPDGVKR